MFDYILNSHVIVTIGNHYNYWTDDPTALDLIAGYAVEAELAELQKRLAGCLVYSELCQIHQFRHGAEAEELRKGIEKIVKDAIVDGLSECDMGGLAHLIIMSLQDLLMEVDAGDSEAYLDAMAKVQR